MHIIIAIDTVRIVNVDCVNSQCTVVVHAETAIYTALFTADIDDLQGNQTRRSKVHREQGEDMTITALTQRLTE